MDSLDYFVLRANYRPDHSDQPDPEKETTMNKQQTLGILRHVLTFGGGFAVAKGYGSEAVVSELIGGILSVIGAVWSIKSKK